MIWPFKRKPETRNYTAQMMDYRMAAIHGQRGVAALSGTVQGCLTLWESGLSLADVAGTGVLTRRLLALIARELGLKGETVIYLPSMTAAAQWDLSTANGRPSAYRLSLPDVIGPKSVTALADEVLHIRIGSRADAPWRGSAPLQRASMTADLLAALEGALGEVYGEAPLGSQVMPMPEDPNIENETMARSFRGRRGRVLLPESTNVAAAGGPTPTTDWKPSDLSPDLSRSMTAESLHAARDSVLACYGVLPALVNDQSAGPVIREAQRHLAQYQLQPIANLIAEEATDKLGAAVALDVLRPTQAFDAGNRARALNGVVQALAGAQDAGLTAEQVATALNFTGIEQ